MKPSTIMASHIFFLILLSYFFEVSEGNFSIPQSRAGRLKTKEKEDSEGYGLKTEEDVRDSRIFSIFSIVQFKNTGCTSTMALSSSSGNTFRNGTCFTNAECGEKGGASSGSCAGGFGVCCVFMTSTCGTTVSQNCSYLKNPGYPSAYTSTSSCQFTINKCDSSVCDLRLDFERFTTNGPAATDETDGGLCQDMLTVTVNTGQAIPEICGENSGQHIYLDLGRGSSDSATLAFTFSGTLSRYWDIKVTQIPCDVTYDPPNGCLQYHTGIDGRLYTFNWGNVGTTQDSHLRNQNYRICIRQEEGYCCVVYMKCDANSFELNPGNLPANTMAFVGSRCTEDYIYIEASNQGGEEMLEDRYCGGIFSNVGESEGDTKIKDCTAPFEVGVITDATTDGMPATTASHNSGVCLEYTQEPCATPNQGP